MALRPQDDLNKAMTAFSIKDIEDSGSFGRRSQKGRGDAYNREVEKMSGIDEGIRYKVGSGEHESMINKMEGAAPQLFQGERYRWYR